ncbi:glycoside hydrolase family 20 protein [Cucurbitaria berberidis CBS 394.84]|uniref:Beta-hexosaminidase n=1 Tax=Cucurbitaria berberidis CBS 394.84 TaxID=1168544 RepID=A0A9P4G756_9PLEO|nr:glycoside hydrolase family 20 protein [Cucurbitaria berberidis CBS 394.84]KAF1840270.1 glycoside hydrolase family 20 protein [Cucurbitaria berberidis CBS 394.84]
MKSFLSILLYTPLTVAIWPHPVTYEHGKDVLFVRRNIPFYVYEAGARNVGSIANQEAFLFASNSNASPEIQDTNSEWRLRKRYTGPPSEDYGHDGYDDTEEHLSGDTIVDYAIDSAWHTIFKKSLYPWKFHPRDWNEPSLHKNATFLNRVDIRRLSHDPRGIAKPLAGEVDESYRITLTEGGKASIIANTSVGIARALATFTQLFYVHSNGKHVYTPLAPVNIYDAPKFQHRGINLDVSRNYFPVADIKRQIDALAYNKMNRFHLHVTDSQSWPLEIPSIPSLSAKGAYRPELVYTARDFRDIQRHAAIQGVEMITEIDMPGHTSSIHYSFPELIAAFNAQPDWETYAAEPPAGTLKLNSTAVYDFLEKLFDDLLPRVHPYSSYFHTGGDEVNMKAYTRDDTVNSSDVAVLQPLMQKFIDRNHNQVRAMGLTPVVWEEMLLDWNITLGKDVIVQSWQSDEAVAKIVKSGHKALVGNYNYWYLDCGKGQWLDFDPSVSADFWPYNDYCAPFHNWRLIYSYDPLAGVPEEHHHLVIGGEAHLWAEQTDPVNIDRMIWPRGSAVAEVLWSGAKDGEGRNRSQIDASPRLSEMRERLVRLGVGAEPIQMPYCLMESEGGTKPQCQLGWNR